MIGNGPQLPLEVFRCKDPRKGWGLRCKDDIYPGNKKTASRIVYSGSEARSNLLAFVAFLILIRCDAGTYVADYIGEVMQESLVETRGMSLLLNLNFYF